MEISILFELTQQQLTWVLIFTAFTIGVKLYLKWSDKQGGS